MFFNIKKENSWKFVDKTATSLEEEGKTECVTHIDKAKKEKDKWVWVEGYKGINNNLTCKDYQYKLNKIHIYEGNIQQCINGFHFCLTLRDVFNYYSLGRSNRYFKVEALVREKDLKTIESIGGNYAIYPNHALCHFPTDSKMVAKQIVFLEEVNFEHEIMKDTINRISPLVKTKEDYNYYNEKGKMKFHEYKFKNTMEKLGFSKAYSQVKFDDLIKKKESIHNFINTVKAYVEEGISKDLMIYLLESKF